eukprot:4469645-Amphidinium_carterae.1
MVCEPLRCSIRRRWRDAALNVCGVLASSSMLIGHVEPACALACYPVRGAVPEAAAPPFPALTKSRRRQVVNLDKAATVDDLQKAAGQT